MGQVSLRERERVLVRVRVKARERERVLVTGLVREGARPKEAVSLSNHRVPVTGSGTGLGMDSGMASAKATPKRLAAASVLMSVSD